MKQRQMNQNQHNNHQPHHQNQRQPQQASHSNDIYGPPAHAGPGRGAVAGDGAGGFFGGRAEGAAGAGGGGRRQNTSNMYQDYTEAQEKDRRKTQVCRETLNAKP